MVTTRSSATQQPEDNITTATDPLAAIAARLATLDTLSEKVAALEIKSIRREKSKHRSHWDADSDDEPNSAVRTHMPFTKLEFPEFSGGDPRGWILKAEKYFRYYETPDDLKVEVASMYLEGDALDLFSWVNNGRTLLFWEELVRTLQEHYGPPEYQNPDEFLCGIQQTGTVSEYRSEFTKRSSHVVNWPEHCLLGVFLNGLKEELRADVRIHKPRTVYRATSLALEYEAKLKVQPGPKLNSGPNSTRPTYRETRGTASSWGATKSATASSSGSKSFLTTSSTEYQNRRDKGLCFRCGEPFRPGHRCSGSLSLMEITEEEEAIAEPLAEEINEESAEISLHAILGKSSGSTMRLKGRIQGRDIMILVDSGSTHNFISDKIVSELQLPVHNVQVFGVQIGDGRRVICSQVCPELEVQVSNLTIKQEFFPFSLGGADVVLGIKWLASLNTVQANWNDMYMIFWIEGKKYKLQGVTSKGESQICLQSLIMQQGVTGSRTAPGIAQVIQDFSVIFDEPTSLPPARGHYHMIPLQPEATPPNLRPYRYPHYQKNEIEVQVAALLGRGFIRPSSSPFASPVLLVSKKDGSWRLCVDYRRLNQITIPDKYPIPNIDELLDELKGAKYFSKIDLRSGYHQIRVLPADVHKTAFRTHSGHYEFVVMPFGLTNAPATFQAIMNDLFRPHLRKCVLVFFDDILVYSPTVQEHLEHLRIIFSILQQHSFYANAKKCSLGQTRIDYLGHIVSSSGVEVVPEKIMAVAHWPTPTSVKDLRGFLGLTGYYRRFVKNYGLIARPLTDLTKKDAFHWSEQAQDAFEKLKIALTTTPVLQLPDFKKPFMVECDASMEGIGAVLMQQGRPIAYFSKGFSFSNRYKSAYDRELLALVLSLQKWRHYLLGHHFFVQTDHHSLKHLLDQKIVTTSQQRLIVKLLPFDFTITYKPGKENTAADSLSRRPQQSDFFHMVIPMADELQQLPQALLDDPKTKAKVEELQTNPNNDSHFHLVSGQLFYKSRLVIPNKLGLREKLVEEAHVTPTGGHGGYLKTLKRLSDQLYWTGMKNDVKHFIQRCITCQQNKYQTLAPAGLLQPLPIPVQIWEDISLDFITGLPKSKGFDVILVVVDRLSKYSHFIPLSHPYSAKTVAEVFCQEVVRLHGMPRSIVSDRDSLFMSTFWQELFHLSQTRLKMSTAYHPQTDGQTEVVNRCLETYLRCFAHEQPKLWSKYLCWAEFSFNTSHHTSSNHTPFKLVYGRDPPPLLPYIKGETLVAELEEQLETRDAMLRVLRDTLLKAQNRMKMQADQHRRDLEFTPGEAVWLRMQPYRQKSVAKRKFEKLSPRFFGPFKILKRIGKVAYELELPASAKIHPVFHVSLLRPAYGQPAPSCPPSLPLSADLELLLTPLKVLKHRWTSDQKLELLIQWENQPLEDATWEEYDIVLEQFPNFRLEDKSVFQGGRNDSSFALTYSRKNKRTRKE